MPYYNPYSVYPATYVPPVQQQSYAQMPMQQSYTAPVRRTMEWVEGEIGAKAFQRPDWLRDNEAIPLWDSTDTNIYLKSWSVAGIPNPLQKLHYTMPEQQQNYLASGAANAGNGQSGNTGNEQHGPDMSQYVTKDDLNAMRNEVQQMLSGAMNRNGNGNNPANQNGISGNYNGSNQNGNNNQGGGNRGGNR